MTPRVRAVRGATTLDADDPDQLDRRVQELVGEMIARNEVDAEDIISIIFTATPDVRSAFPATSARRMGLDSVPVMGAQELDVEGGMARCIRVMMHVETERSRPEIAHVYLRGAANLQSTGGRSAGAGAVPR